MKRLIGQRQLHRFGAVARFGYDLEIMLGVEHQLESLAHNCVVIGEQDACLQRGGHGAPQGTSRRTSVPPCGLVRIASAASTSNARSRMP
jgi:hypothetical protein